MSSDSSVDPKLPPSQTVLNNDKDISELTMGEFKRIFEEELNKRPQFFDRLISHSTRAYPPPRPFIYSPKIRPPRNTCPQHENSSNYSSGQDYDDDDVDTVTTNNSTNKEEVEEAFNFIISELDSDQSPINHFIADTLEGMLKLWSSQHNHNNDKQTAKSGTKEISTETTQAKIYKRDLQSDEERRQMQILNQNKQILAALHSSQPNIRWRPAKDHNGAN
jgi:hypothetical protein